MMMVTVRDQWYFPMQFRIVGVVAILASVGVATTHLLGAAVVFLVGVIIVTTHYGFAIDKEARVYQEYIWLLGWRAGKKVRFHTMHYLLINPAKITRTYNLRVNSTTISELAYNGYVKIDDGEKIHIVGSTNKRVVLKAMEKLKDYLGIRLTDNSGEVQVEI